MPQVFNASLCVTLPEDGMATAAAKLLAAWGELVEVLEKSNPGMSSDFGINETWAKPATAGAKRGPKAKQAPPDLGGEAA